MWSWNYLAYPGALFLGILLKALIEKLDREVIKPEIQSALDAAFSKFKLEMIEELNGTYVRAAGSHLTGNEIQRRLETLEGGRGRWPRERTS